jgi:arsenite methyltransferase
MAARLDLNALLTEDGIEACCAALYENPAVRWLLGGELHPGGEEATRRALELIELRPGERLLDVGSGGGTSALLATREFGCRAAGLDYGAEAINGARRAADAAGLGDRVDFVAGEAGALPFADGEFDAVLCECSLSTFPDKEAAVDEMRRVLRPGGRTAISDVIVDPERILAELRGPIATIACVGGALRREGYEKLLAEAELELLAVESRDADVARLAERVEERLRGVRLLGLDRFDGSPFGIEEAIDLTRLARRAIADGSLGYLILAARCR